MADQIHHRGPDEDGFLVQDGVGLAFRRLKIIDLHTGSQPQTNEDGTIHVVFNGEIYNYRELRQQLIARGHLFKTSSDTEVLVHLYEEKGPDLVNELNGMFSLAIWDSREKTLLLARDQVGIKPLLYADIGDRLVFGAEMGCFLEADLDLDIDPVAVHHFLSWGAIPAPQTIYRQVKRLPPGHVLVWRNGQANVRRYWHPLVNAPEVPKTFEEGAELLRALLDESVRMQMVSDVPLGAFLSGGVDSTTIAGLMRRKTDDVHTFSIGFSDDPVFDETPYAREAAAFHGTKHREEQLTADDIRDVIPTVLNSLTEPFGSASLLPTFVVSRETRRFMTVALSGDGADELFGGYNKYLGETYRQRYQKIPAPLRKGILDPAIRSLPASRGSHVGEWGRKAKRFLEGFDGDACERHDRWMRYASAADVSSLLGEERVTNPGVEIIRGLHRDYAEHGGTESLNRILFTDLSLALPTDMLVKVDTASMLNSLEVRVPFLDHRIVALAMSMPGEWKMKGTQRKRILKQAIGDLLPPGIQNRPKAGFDVPVGEWLKTSLRDLFWDTVNSDGSIPLDPTQLSTWYEEHRSGRADRAKVLWAAFALRWWEKNHSSRHRRQSPLQLETVS